MKKEMGAGMIEVLIALVICAIGVLGSRIQIISATVMDWRGGEASC